ncbi:MAG: hypothetical protein ACXV3C_02855 [Actinomycetes bacterium]
MDHRDASGRQVVQDDQQPARPAVRRRRVRGEEAAPQHNPFADTQLPDRRRDQSTGISALTEAEFRPVYDFIHPDSKAVMEVAVGTGARRGELTALTVDDLALGQPTPTQRINKAWKLNCLPGKDRADGEMRYVLGPPKSRGSTRAVALAAPIVALTPAGSRLWLAPGRGTAWRSVLDVAMDLVGQPGSVAAAVGRPRPPRCRVGSRRLRCRSMTEIVLRVRLIGGEHLDVSYEEPGAADDDQLREHVISTLAQDSGVLRTRHGHRLVVLFGRGVAALEVAPRGAVL